MGSYLDSVPMSGIIRIRDMMYSVANPFRLDQGDVSFDAPDTVKEAMIRAVEQNRTHYLPTTGVPRLRELLAEKLRTRNGIPVEGDDDILVTNGGTHGVYAACQALLEPDDEVIVPNPEWPPTMAMVLAAHGQPKAVPLHESTGWRWDLDELERAITAKTKVIYVNSPNNPTGGLLTLGDLERIAAIARERNLWVFSDEAYEDVVFEGEHVSIASLPGMYDSAIWPSGITLSGRVPRRSCSTRRATSLRSPSMAPLAHWKGRRTRSHVSVTSCALDATCSIRACRRLRGASSAARRPPPRSMRSFVSIPRGSRKPPTSGRNPGAWPST
jgi:hypothetical protein